MDKPVENDHVFKSTQELLVDGHHLIEKKQKTLRHANGIETGLVLVHIRTIDDKSYKVTEIIDYLTDVCCCSDDDESPEIETEMTENEVKQFKEDWTRLWNPDFTKKEINSSSSSEASESSGYGKFQRLIAKIPGVSSSSSSSPDSDSDSD